MRKEIADKWVEALRSGEYTQHKGALANADRTEHCCLGVLCELAIKDGVSLHVDSGFEGRTSFNDGGTCLPVDVAHWAGTKSLRGGIGSLTPSLMTMNDKGRPFSEIAAVIEEHWEKL